MPKTWLVRFVFDTRFFTVINMVDRSNFVSLTLLEAVKDSELLWLWIIVHVSKGSELHYVFDC